VCRSAGRNEPQLVAEDYASGWVEERRVIPVTPQQLSDAALIAVLREEIKRLTAELELVKKLLVARA
jgi:hypothetical protein